MTNPYESPKEDDLQLQLSWRALVPAALCWAAIAATTLATFWQFIPVSMAVIIILLCLMMALSFQIGSASRVEMAEMPSHRSQRNVLTTEMLETQEFDYQQALYRFSQGEALIFEGAVFRLSPASESPMRLTASASVPARDDDSAWRVAAFVQQVNEHLRERSVEFANLTENHELRIVFFLSYAALEEEIGGIVDGKLMWFLPAGFA